MTIQDLIQNPHSFVRKLIRFKAWQLARHPGFRDVQQRDIEQELILEVLRKADCYDPERAGINTFAALVIEHGVISLYRTRIADKRSFLRDDCSLSEFIFDKDLGWVERAQTTDGSQIRRHTGQSPRDELELAQLQQDVAAAIDALPDDLKPLAELLQKTSRHAASRELEQSRRQVANDVARMRRHFERAELRRYLE